MRAETSKKTKNVYTMTFNLLCRVRLRWLSIALLSFSQVANAHQTEVEFCGYESPPATAGFVLEYNRVEKQKASLGYVRACEAVLQRYDLEKIATSWDEMLPTLGFAPTDLSRTPFAKFELLGGVLDATIPRFGDLEKTDHATRVFKMPNGKIVSLEEHDLSIMGGGWSTVYGPPDVMVKGWPAYWSILQAKSGKTYSILSWMGKTRLFNLTINANLKLTGGQADFLRLAESVPPGIPRGKLKPVVTVVGSPGELTKIPIPNKPPPFPGDPKF